MKHKRSEITVLLGLSGGVDSSVAALLLKRKGYRVIGAFFKVYSESKNPLTGECSYLQDKKDAQRIAMMLNIPFVVLDFEKIYKKNVINPLFEAYKKGLTPNPDISCNAIIKFPILWKEARKLGAEYIATGHYARIRKFRERCVLLQGRDSKKDQSYFLSGLSQDDLSHSLFPIGELTKNRVRRIAKSRGFTNWDKHGTTGICFVGKVDMHDFLRKRIRTRRGAVVMPDGNRLGEHDGTAYYTIGQKAGSHVGININKPRKDAQKRFYVAEKRKGNVLVVAPEGHSILKKDRVIVRKIHLIGNEKIINKKFKARIRNLGRFYSGKIIRRKGRMEFIFSRPVNAVADGQYIVFYKGSEVIGSGEMRFR